jgi:benzoate membrane transport protein
VARRCALCGGRHLVVGILGAAAGQMAWSVEPGLAMPVFTAPQFSVSAIVSLALPLFVVTMASQNLPGVAVMRAQAMSCRCLG